MTQRHHPLATVAVVIALVPMAGGVIGGALGAVAGVVIRRHPERWRGAEWATVAVVLGLFTGPFLLVLFGGLYGGPQGESWGWWVLAFGLLSAAIIGGTALVGRRGGGSVVGGAVLAVLGIVVVLGLAVGVVLFVVWMLRMTGEGIAEG